MSSRRAVLTRPTVTRMHSAGQIPCLFQKWLNSFMTDQKRILKIGNHTRAFDFLLPQHLKVSMLQFNSALSMIVRSRLATFSRGVLVHPRAATHVLNVHVVGWAPHYTMAFVCLKHGNKPGKHV
jgi:hypothetical protein